MEAPDLIALAADRLDACVEVTGAPALMPLPSIWVAGEIHEHGRNVRLHGEALYALHRGARAQWAVIVRESDAIPPGSVRLIDLDAIRCETLRGRRGG